MMDSWRKAAMVLVLGISGAAVASPTTQPTTEPSQFSEGVPPVLNFTMKALDGKEVNLSKYKGKVLLIVNTASKCGHTPQYAPLEALYKKYSDQGFMVLGFPANNFKSQEPGTDAEISTFCTKNYGVTFDMFSKIDVKGPKQADLYKYLTGVQTDKIKPGDITWNFEKFLVARDGTVVDRFAPKVKPDSPQVVEAIETELKK